MPGFDVICCVVNIGDASRTLKIAKKYGVKGGTIALGRGTVHSHLLELLGVTEVRREILTMVIEKELAFAAIKGISEEMAFHKPHHGIAFAYAVSEFLGSRNNPAQKPENSEEKKIMYNVIYTIVEKGKAEEVIEAAQNAGSKGGTIMNARGAGIHEVQKLFSVDIEPEKEVVFILTECGLKSNIVESIRTRLKIDEPGNGVMYVLDVDEVYGLV